MPQSDTVSTVIESNRDPLEAFRMVRSHLGRLAPFQVEELRRRTDPYLGFRDEVEEFQKKFRGY